MAYCRFSDSDAYIYDDIYIGLNCCVCILQEDGNSFVAGDDYELMISHIAEHRKAGHSIPDYVEMELESDRDDKEWQARRGKLEVYDIDELLNKLGFNNEVQDS